MSDRTVLVCEQCGEEVEVLFVSPTNKTTLSLQHVPAMHGRKEDHQVIAYLDSGETK